MRALQAFAFLRSEPSIGTCRTCGTDAALFPLEANVGLALLHQSGGDNGHQLVSLAVGSFLNQHGAATLAAAQAAREAGNAPNAVLAAAVAIVGPKQGERMRRSTRWLIDAFAAAGLRNAVDEGFDLARVVPDAAARELLLAPQRDAQAMALLDGFDPRGARSVFVRWLRSLGGRRAAVLAALAATLGWRPLMHKRVTRPTVECLGPWLQLFGTSIGASVEAARHEPARFCGIDSAELLGRRRSPKPPSSPCLAGCRARRICSPSSRWWACC